MSSPQQKGIAERKHKNIENVIRSLLVKACIYPSFWVEALHVAIHLTNRIPSCSVLAGQCIYHILHGHVPNDIHLIRTFGFPCYPDIQDVAPHKLSPRSLPCVSFEVCKHKGFRCLYPATGRVYISRHVTFSE